MFFEQIKENPFKSDERKFPIDFAYTSQEVIEIKISLPEDYSVYKLPTSMYLNLTEKGGIYYYNATVNANTLTLKNLFIYR
ncbi:MAG: hypothetical protein HC906_06530 [Bacteroidales bacterium]|nr:hypothetical protein [Bacteroidales bacterium]